MSGAIRRVAGKATPRRIQGTPGRITRAAAGWVNRRGFPLIAGRMSCGIPSGMSCPTHRTAAAGIAGPGPRTMIRRGAWRGTPMVTRESRFSAPISAPNSPNYHILGYYSHFRVAYPASLSPSYEYVRLEHPEMAPKRPADCGGNEPPRLALSEVKRPPRLRAGAERSLTTKTQRTQR